MYVCHDLAGLPESDWIAVSYEEIIGNKAAALQRLCQFADVPFGPRMRALATEALPHSRYTLTPPDPDKWQRHRDQIESQLPAVQDTQARLAQLTSH